MMNHRTITGATANNLAGATLAAMVTAIVMP